MLNLSPQNEPTMYKKQLFVFFFFLFWSSYAQEKSFWKSAVMAADANRWLSKQERPFDGVFELDWEQWKLPIVAAASVAAKTKGIRVVLPNAEGKMEEYSVVEDSNFDPVLQVQYPSIQSFRGRGITDPNATVFFSSSTNGIQTMVLRNNAPSEFLEPVKGEWGKYILYRSDTKGAGGFALKCTTDAAILRSKLPQTMAKTVASDRRFRTLRLALSCTGEYTAYHGGTKTLALAAMNATMTRVNAVFNRDLALKLVLVADNVKVIFDDATTDPYSAVVGGNAPSLWSSELEKAVSSALGASNYDIGHLFGASGGGGNAGCIGCVCNFDKARAYTSPSNERPEGDLFDIDFVAHEFGHQLGATHTFSHELEDEQTNVEPGSGSTIMGYAGITDFNIQNSSDDYFGFVSINQIQQNMATRSCLIPMAIATPLFGVNAGVDYTIPKNTPFQLKGTTSGAVNDAFTYVWEQNDSAVTAFGANSLAIANKPDGPLFRSFPPSGALDRYFPSYDKVLVNRLNSEWESVCSVGRTLTFVFTARDNAALGFGQTASDETKITVSNTVGPFQVTSQNTADLSWSQGSTQAISWSVNGTNSLSGAANVDIKLSVDGGATFPITLVANTPNDGSQAIVVPNIEAAVNCRILIAPTNSVFYALNSVPFAIGFTTFSACNTYPFAAPISIPDGIGAYTTKEIVVPPGLGEVVAVTVDLVISHAYLSDVELEIVSPQNKTVRLLQRICSDANTTLRLTLDDGGVIVNCANTSAQVITPADLLSGFNSQDPSGTWILRVRDRFPVDSGSITTASVTICSKKATLGYTDSKIDDFNFYPNPSNGGFTIQFNGESKGEVLVTVHDFMGRKVHQEQFPNALYFEERIDLKNVRAGAYLLTVEDGNRKQTQTILVN